jgi:hypothetical protein
VSVSVDESREDCSAPKIDYSGGPTPERPGLRVGSDEQNFPPSHSEGGSDGARVIDRVDLSVDEDEVGSHLRSKRNGCKRGERKVGWEMSHAPEFAF